MHATPPPYDRAGLRKRAIAVALAVAAVYALFSWNYLLQPSRHFHFVDMAWGLLHGRFDTDTPRRAPGQPAHADDPPGFQAAVDRHLLDATGKNLGWNDWASYRRLTLKGGQELKGAFPWKDDAGPRKYEFYAFDGKTYIIDVAKDLKTGCDQERPWAACDDVVHQVSFPPLPAVLMAPLVAVLGYRVNDVWFTLAFAVLAAVLALLWLERMQREGLIVHGAANRLWLVGLFAFSSVMLYCSIRGEVWFTALTVGVACHFAYLLAADGARAPLLAGLLFGLGVATRTPILFAGVFFPLEAAWPDGRFLGGNGVAGLRRALGKIALFALPTAAIGLALAVHNQVRWGNPLEFGHFYLLEGTRGPTRDHGLFNFAFLNHNLGTSLLNMPRLMLDPPYVLVTRHGLGLLACTPALLALFGTPRPPPDAAPLDPALAARRRSLVRNLGLSVLAVALPGLFYQNDGWQQFGYRFALDFWPALLGFFALRVPHLSRTTKTLIVLGFIVQAFGAVTFGRMEGFYYD
jgi:hypothetical protein